MRIALVGRGISTFANMKIRLVQFEHVVAPFLLNALMESRVLSVASNELSTLFDIGLL